MSPNALAAGRPYSGAMEPQRSLRAVFGNLAGGESARGQEEGGDLGDILAAEGYPGLPDTLIAEAVASYADTAPAEVAEHLAPFVMANSPVPVDDLPDELDSRPALDPLDLLATAPTSLAAGDELADSAIGPDDDLVIDAAAEGGETFATFGLDFGGLDFGGLDFGGLEFGEGDVGTGASAVLEEADVADEAEEAASATEPVHDTVDAFTPEGAGDGSFDDDASLLDAVAAAQSDDAADNVVDNRDDIADDDEVPDF
jgi:hypothetical protein